MYAVERQPTQRLDDADLAPLVERARAGDADAFEALVRRLQGPVRAFSRRLLADDALGDDAAQEAFVRMWRGIRRLKGAGAFTSWAFTIARNTAIELLRKEKRTPTPVDELPTVTAVTDDLALRRVVREAVRDLPEPYRTTFCYREAGLSYEEIADAVSTPVGTVRSRLHSARRLLSERLAPVIFGGEDDELG